MDNATSRVCYAAELGDCRGKVNSREHYISKVLLQRLGREFEVSGLSWLNEPRKLTEKGMTSKVLCQKHNEGLSSLDAEVVRLWDILETIAFGQYAGLHTLDGTLLERWALKVMIGMLASGNARRVDDVRVKDRPLAELLTAEARARYLPLLFGHESMPNGWGMRIRLSPTVKRDAQIEIVLNSFDGDPEDKLIHGVTVQMLGLFFTTSLMAIPAQKDVWFRPPNVRLDGLASIDFEWDRTQSTNPSAKFSFARRSLGAAMMMT